MKILAIDPGYDRLGIAVVEKENSAKENLLFSECLQTSSKDPFEKRLLQVGQEVERIIENYQPEALAIESLFLSNNQKTAMRVAEVRGAIIYLAEKNNMTVREFTPLEVKMAIAGHGKGSKDDILRMLPHLIATPLKGKKDDEIDAIAIGLTFFAYNKIAYPQKIK